LLHPDRASWIDSNDEWLQLKYCILFLALAIGSDSIWQCIYHMRFMTTVFRTTLPTPECAFTRICNAGEAMKMQGTIVFGMFSRLGPSFLLNTLSSFSSYTIFHIPLLSTLYDCRAFMTQPSASCVFLSDFSFSRFLHSVVQNNINAPPFL
jgi:hypothetical protein